MPKENKTPDKCCEKCRHDVNTCTRWPCNIANNYDLFEPIIKADPKNPSWEIISFTWDKTDDHLLINLRDKTGTVIMVTLSPDNIADMGLAR